MRRTLVLPVPTGAITKTASWKQRIGGMLGLSKYQQEAPRYGGGGGVEIDDEQVEAVRKYLGGNIQQIPVTQLRWYLADLEIAQSQADAGFLERPCQLYRAMQRDGVLAGLLATRTAGLVRLPKRFYGKNPEIINALRANNGSRSVFDEMCPPAELAALAGDGVVIGAGVAELVPVQGRNYPVLVRMDPEWLRYSWADGFWYYVTRAGNIRITPGDGRWVLHVPGGRIAPWRWGLWPCLGRSFIAKEHSMSMRAGFIAGVANPARLIEAPQGATEQQRKAFFAHVMKWGPNTVLELPVGWTAKLLEITGRAWEIFQKQIDTCDQEYMVALCGQIVTTTGGTGFQNSDVQRVIRSDLIKADGENLAYTLNTQVVPAWVANEFGLDALDAGTKMLWDTATPKDLESESRTLLGLANAIEGLTRALAPYDRQINIDELTTRFGLPMAGDPDAESAGISEAPKVAPKKLELVVDDAANEAQKAEAA